MASHERWLWAVLVGCFTAACGETPSTPTPPRVPVAPPAAMHDFGLIPHGQARRHEFVLDTHALGGDHVALGVHADCSCARSRMLLRRPDGQQREITGQPLAEFAARPDERLVVELQVDTAQKEAVDLAPVQSHAWVELQPTSGADAVARRVRWPLVFRYGVDAPVRLQPFAVLDFQNVALTTDRQLLTTLRSDIPGQRIRFGPATCEDRRLQLELVDEAECSVLRATFTPAAGDQGTFTSLVRIATDLPDGYVVQLAAVGKIVPDLEATPYAKISLRADLRQPQPESAGRSQAVVVTDHDRRRPAEFVVAEFVDDGGRDANDRFAVCIEPIDGDPRSHRVGVRGRGGAGGNFRGRLVLAKDPQEGPFLPIEVVAFHVPRP